jgi:hypothetical protein
LLKKYNFCAFFCEKLLLTNSNKCAIIVGAWASDRLRVPVPYSIWRIFLSVWTCIFFSAASRNSLPASPHMAANSECFELPIFNLIFIKNYDIIIKKD